MPDTPGIADKVSVQLSAFSVQRRRGSGRYLLGRPGLSCLLKSRLRRLEGLGRALIKIRRASSTVPFFVGILLHFNAAAISSSSISIVVRMDSP